MQADYWNHNPEFVAEVQQPREKSLEAQLKVLEDGANQKRLQNTMVCSGDDERHAKRMIAVEDAENEHIAAAPGSDGLIAEAIQLAQAGAVDRLRRRAVGR
ncbi:hypothetical protein [Synechococcus sp. MIT S9504]|uniref:hypothetical protein n=1 Tax=Synechococcus sp. MIT S9504 TaxID=1801628 RepID=UPI0007BBF4E6|nr:hypothetical protein [Synechococcus sp. MIT S9504]KZR87177.1 hypothetical protein MITS9504_00593 [Synechococcus sp. MIT S9504]